MKLYYKKFDLPGSMRRVNRSPLRLFLGSLYYRIKRYLLWIKLYKKFSKTYANAPEWEKEFPYKVFSHSSPLFRDLRGVDPILQKNKTVNLQVAGKKLHLIIVKPGEIFSFWFLVGRPTRSRGFLPGVQLRNGSFFAGTGGGLCQMANLIYWMTLHTSLTIRERWRHSFDVFPDSERTLPFGSGATVSYNYIDLMIENTGTAKYLLKIYQDGTHLFGEWYSDLEIPFLYEVYQSSHEFRSEPYGGYTRRNTIRRKIFHKDSKELLEDEIVTENSAWVMYTPILPHS